MSLLWPRSPSSVHSAVQFHLAGNCGGTKTGTKPQSRGPVCNSHTVLGPSLQQMQQHKLFSKPQTCLCKTSTTEKHLLLLTCLLLIHEERKGGQNSGGAPCFPLQQTKRWQQQQAPRDAGLPGMADSSRPSPLSPWKQDPPLLAGRMSAASLSGAGPSYVREGGKVIRYF